MRFHTGILLFHLIFRNSSFFLENNLTDTEHIKCSCSQWVDTGKLTHVSHFEIAPNDRCADVVEIVGTNVGFGMKSLGI